MFELPKEVVEVIVDYCSVHPQCEYCVFKDKTGKCKLYSEGFPCDWELE